MICGKRHHTRFYPTEEGNAAGDGNPRPGTVVDRGVTAVYEFDFFLQGVCLSWFTAYSLDLAFVKHMVVYKEPLDRHTTTLFTTRLVSELTGYKD